MTITKCDICAKQIKREDIELSVSVCTPADFSSHTICSACGTSILAFLNDHWLFAEGDDRRKRRSRRRSA
ncbi:MAG TPA: hypothetical protein VGN17_05310 [Bryobacteraceae bacterium]|jgi:hypothetical protein